MREQTDDIPEGDDASVPADSTASEVDAAAQTQVILDRAAAERAELDRMRNAPAAALPGEDPEKKSSRWARLRDELLDPGWKTIITVLTTSGLSLAVGLVLVYTAR